MPTGSAADLSVVHSPAVTLGDELHRAGKVEQAIKAYLAVATAVEVAPAPICLKLARSYERQGNDAEACRWALAVVDAADDFPAWQAASALLQRCGARSGLTARRSAKVALLGSYTTTHFAPLLRLAAWRFGLGLDIYESPYGQYRQAILDETSQMYAFAPDFIVLAVHEGELQLPDYSLSPEEDVEAEVQRWTTLWQTAAKHSSARLVQYNFALPCEVPMGHLGARSPQSRYLMTQLVNARLGERAGNAASLVDVERLSALFGKQRWFDPRYWYLAKQAVAPEALPLLARHTAAVLAADMGLSRKCLVFDLDNTLWGGVIAEDGLAGITLGNGVDGEAYVAFQDYLLKLKRKGVLLAVCSKNNEADAKEPFEKHPEMHLKLDDIALFVANWQPKPDNLRLIADTLNIGLDALVFVDDNPAERAAVRQLVPEVDVIPMPADPTQYTRALSQYLLFETGSFTPEDAERTEQYHARARLAALQTSARSLEDYYRSLRMQAIIAPFDEVHLPRIAQLIGKTNQFNLTTPRYTMPQLLAFMADPHCLHFWLRLRDCFTNHGLVSLMIARRQGELLDIDTWLMSCRVIDRTVETTMLAYLSQQAQQLGCTTIRGTYIPTAKSAMVKELYAKFGFDVQHEHEGTSTYLYNLRTQGPITNEFIQVVDSWEDRDAAP